MKSIRDEVVALEDRELSSCQSITHTVKRVDINSGYDPSWRPTPERLGEFAISLPMREIYFSDQSAAAACGNKIIARAQEFRALFRRTQDVQRDRDQKVTEFNESKQAEAAPFQKKAQELQTELGRMQPVIAETSKRAAEERILGAPLGTDTNIDPQDKTGSTDWAQIISSNLTRLSSLGIMFFLVAILVPQYRYNLRMAAFYDARADSIRLAGELQPINQLQDLEKAIVAMTPNIDFGKAPATPIDQLVELIKAARR